MASLYTRSITASIPQNLIYELVTSQFLEVVDNHLGGSNSCSVRYKKALVNYAVLNFAARDSFLDELDAANISGLLMEVVDYSAEQNPPQASAVKIVVYHNGIGANAKQHIDSMGLERLPEE